MELLLFLSGFSGLSLLLDWCLFWFFLFVSNNVFWQSFGFPNTFKQVLKKFAFNKWNFFLDFSQEFELLRILVCINDVFFDDFLDLLLTQLYSNTAVFGELYKIDSTLGLLIF